MNNVPPKDIQTDLNNDGITDVSEANTAVHVDQWKNRRAMAFFALRFVVLFALLFILISTLASPVVIDNLDQFNSIFVTVIGGLISIVLAYYGATVYSDVNAPPKVARQVRPTATVDDPE